MYSIRVEGDIGQLKERLQQLTELDKKGLNMALSEVVVESTDERFRLSKDPTGRRWPTSERAAREGGKTLIRTSFLRSSIHGEADDTGWAVGTNVKYAATHQFGADRTIRPKRAKALRFKIGDQWIMRKQVRVKIPARPFLGLSDEDWEEIRQTVEDFIGGDS